MTQRGESVLEQKLEQTSKLIQQLMEKLQDSDRKILVLQTKFDSLKERFKELSRILIGGNGSGIEVKTARFEERIKHLEDTIDELKNYKTRSERESKRAFWAIVVALLAFVMNILFYLITKGI